MTKEPQPTTHNAERGARGTCRERSGTGLSPKRTEQNVRCSLIGETTWRFGVKCLAFLERTCGKIRWRVGGNVFGALEKTCSTIWRKRVR